MESQTQTTVRNAGFLVLLRGAQVASGFLFATFIPRLMGPDTYGQYNLLASLALWFTMASELGFTQVMARYGPRLAHDRSAFKLFFARLLTVRSGSGLIAAASYLLLTLLWLRDLDPLVLLFLAGGVCLRALAHQFFTLFLGVNRADRWGMAQVMRGWLTLALLPAGFLLRGLVGAAAAFLLVEASVLLAGIGWGKSHVDWPRLRRDWPVLGPELRFGLLFFAGGLLQTAFQRSGPALIRAVTGDYAQVGYFGLANDITMTVAQVFPQVAMAFSAVFVTWLDGGQEQEVRRWAERLSAALAAGGMVVILAVLFLAEHLVPVVLGAAYRPVTPSLIVLAASLLLLALSNLAHVLAMVRDRPDIALSSAAVRLAALWIIGPFLIRAEQSLGASLAALVASVLYTLFIVVRVQRVMPFSLRRWLLAVALGGVCLPLLWLRSSLPVDSLLFVLSVAVYAALLLAGRVVTWRELASAWQMIRPTGGARASERVP